MRFLQSVPALCLFPLLAIAAESAPPPASMPVEALPSQPSVCMSPFNQGCIAPSSMASADHDASSVHCDLYSVNFRRCLAGAASQLVRRDAGQPQAVTAYRVSSRDDVTGAMASVTVLASAHGEVSDAVGGMRFTLRTAPAPDDSADIAYHVEGSVKAQGNLSFRAGDVQSIQVGHEVISISRL
jgi:hypothetical protein